ncbi:hypothetical protein GCM10027277_07870 [Pseudoduganella ginsengisoli]
MPLVKFTFTALPPAANVSRAVTRLAVSANGSGVVGELYEVMRSVYVPGRTPYASFPFAEYMVLTVLPVASYSAYE